VILASNVLDLDQNHVFWPKNHVFWPEKANCNSFRTVSITSEANVTCHWFKTHTCSKWWNNKMFFLAFFLKKRTVVMF